MYLYNTSFHADSSVAETFIAWLKTIFIPEAMSSVLFSEASLGKILLEIEPGTSSYTLQFKARELDRAREWNHTIGNSLRSVIVKKFGGKVVFFVTFIEIIDHE